MRRACSSSSSSVCRKKDLAKPSPVLRRFCTSASVVKATVDCRANADLREKREGEVEVVFEGDSASARCCALRLRRAAARARRPSSSRSACTCVACEAADMRSRYAAMKARRALTSDSSTAFTASSQAAPMCSMYMSLGTDASCERGNCPRHLSTTFITAEARSPRSSWELNTASNWDNKSAPKLLTMSIRSVDAAKAASSSSLGGGLTLMEAASAGSVSSAPRGGSSFDSLKASALRSCNC
mmetsp:Transcript_63954/g.129909  ORF Transcript_63954/g.129909 Transcript_63954/m.129909 type:complete len:242 (+) Transcript_63954:225-950(+)